MGKIRKYKQRKRAVYDEEKIAWIKEHFTDDYKMSELAEMFSERFGHKVSTQAFMKATSTYCGHKKRVKHSAMPDRKNKVGDVIADSDGKKCRVKTENGYMQADIYFKKLYGLPDNCRILHLNGDFTDFSRENIMPVSRGVHTAMAFRHWFFRDPERTKAAALCAELIILLGASKNENQFLKLDKR